MKKNGNNNLVIAILLHFLPLLFIRVRPLGQSAEAGAGVAAAATEAEASTSLSLSLFLASLPL